MTKKSTPRKPTDINHFNERSLGGTLYSLSPESVLNRLKTRLN